MSSSRSKDPSAAKKSTKSASSSKSKEIDTHKLALRGSSKLVTEFFEYSINTILFQRGVYPPEDFAPVKKYGLNMMVTLDDEVKAYIKKIMSQLSKWMQKSKISKLVIVVTSKETGEHVERWQFSVDLTGDGKKGRGKDGDSAKDKENAEPAKEEKEKGEQEIQSEIQALFRQITASVSFLPMLDGNCTFNVLVYADADSEVPLEWGDSDAKEVKNAEKVMLRSFSTNSHRVDTVVSYRLAD
ncbi:Mitotic spindle checkpoint component mad2 [Pseudocercospora fuligena]|uniref:Mitotic spindle checkpoint component mad2 n=1 Tax=Pseudocercospora fuligena TaxID=685502 RepID=A0A8H6RHY4_9PEZI|nr:Mitotic spindle checkpoint component mad2 [Pseudocercospora fuligena]